MFPRLFSIGSFYIPTYGVLVALGFLTGLWVATRLGRKAGLNPDNVANLALYCAFSGILGAKLFMFLFDLPEYIQNPGQIFSMETLQAAGVFHGGFILALLVSIWFIRKHKMPVWRTMDAFAPGVVVGQAIGRLGCFAAGCCWGRACDLPWAVRFHSDLAAPVPLNTPLHPVQLYESTADLFIFGLLYRMASRSHKDGSVIGWYLVLYSVARFIIEFYRNHEQSLVMGLSLTQWIAVGLFALGLGFLLRPHAVRTQPTGIPAQTSQSIS